MARKYSELRSMVKDYLNDECDYTMEEIADFIYESYQQEVITGQQYDKLNAELEDF